MCDKVSSLLKFVPNSQKKKMLGQTVSFFCLKSSTVFPISLREKAKALQLPTKPSAFGSHHLSDSEPSTLSPFSVAPATLASVLLPHAKQTPTTWLCLCFCLEILPDIHTVHSSNSLHFIEDFSNHPI